MTISNQTELKTLQELKGFLKDGDWLIPQGKCVAFQVRIYSGEDQNSTEIIELQDDWSKTYPTYRWDDPECFIYISALDMEKGKAFSLNNFSVGLYLQRTFSQEDVNEFKEWWQWSLRQSEEALAVPSLDSLGFLPTDVRNRLDSYKQQHKLASDHEAISKLLSDQGTD